MDRITRLKSWHKLVVDRLTGQPVIFHHVPKCGGTSVARALRMRYLLSQATVHPLHSHAVVQDFYQFKKADEAFRQARIFRQQMLLYHLYEDVRCVAAHVPFLDIAHLKFGDKYKFITILRDPIERFISHYYHSFERNDYSRIELSLDQYIDSAEAKQLGATYSVYLGGLNLMDFTADSAVETACTNLEKFDCIGFVEDMPTLEKHLNKLLGVRLSIGHENRGKLGGFSYRETLPPDLIAKVEKICAPDIKIYDYAQKLAGFK